MLQNCICGEVANDPDLRPRPRKKRKIQDISVGSKINSSFSMDTSSTYDISTQVVKEICFTDSFTGKDPDKEFPVLHKFNIPLDYNWISALLRDIVKLSRYSDGNILRFQYYNQYSSTLIAIPESANQYRFDRNTKEKGSWLQKLLAALVPPSIPNGNDQALLWLTSFIGSNYNDTFVSVCHSLGLILNGKKMDAESAAAMWEAANVNLKQQRIILKYMSVYFGRRLTVPESHIRELEEGALLPITGEYTTTDNKTVHYWYKDINSVVLHRLECIVKHHGVQHLALFDRIFIILGGDTGGRMFRSVVKMVLFSTNTRQTSQYVMKVGHINCDKDTRIILENTIGVHLNNGLKKLVNKYIFIERVTHHNEYSITLRDENSLSNDYDSANFYSSPLSVKITGDLAFLCTALGKENMSGHWCPWCMLSPTDWSLENHQPGEKWTINKMIMLREQLEEAERNNSSSSPGTVKGCTDTPLFDSVPLDDYVVPVLHILIGVGNRLLNSVFEWIKERIEKRSDQHKEISNLIHAARLNLETATENFNSWIQQQGILLTEKQIEKNQIKEQLSEKDDNGKFVIVDRNIRREMSYQITLLTQETKLLQQEKKQLQDTKAECSKQLTITKSNGKTAMEALGKIKNPICEEIEDKILNLKHGITRAHYHGGEFNGKGVMKLMNDADLVMRNIRDHILEKIPENERAGNDEICDFLSKYSNVLLVFDKIFSTARARIGSLDDGEIQTLVEYIKQALVLWRRLKLSVTPKIHVLEDHLVEQLVKEENGLILRGIGEFTEDFVEQAHQFGNRDEGRTRGLKDHAAKARSHSYWEHKSLNPAVQVKHFEVEIKSRRNIKKGENGMTSAEEKVMQKKAIKDDTRKAALELTIGYVEKEEFNNFTGADRNYSDYKRAVNNLVGNSTTEHQASNK